MNGRNETRLKMENHFRCQKTIHNFFPQQQKKRWRQTLKILKHLQDFLLFCHLSLKDWSSGDRTVVEHEVVGSNLTEGCLFYLSFFSVLQQVQLNFKNGFSCTARDPTSLMITILAHKRSLALLLSNVTLRGRASNCSSEKVPSSNPTVS